MRAFQNYMPNDKNNLGFPYPEKVASLVRTSPNRKIINANAHGRAVTPLCGVSIDFDIEIDDAAGTVTGAAFRTNGCGYVVAAGNVFSKSLSGKRLAELNALDCVNTDLHDSIGGVASNRKHCIEICVEALLKALADFRLKKIDEWAGEGVLICSCFGVSQQRIEELITERELTTVEEVGDSCNAGHGCGSCQPIIQELLDAK